MSDLRKFLCFLIPGICLFVFLTGCSDKSGADWTILIYMAADNSLNEAAIDEINEMEAAILADNINVVIQIDNREGNLYGMHPGARRYLLQQDSFGFSPEIVSPVISSLGEIDSGSEVELAEFVNWGFANYPADKKALIIWSHGNGWLNAYNQFCPDNESGNSISVQDGELAAAFNLMNYQPDLLILDACYMQTSEVLTEIGTKASYIIGSEDRICTDGFPYSDLLSFWNDFSTIEALCLEITQTYIASYRPGGSQYQQGINPQLSCSCLRTDKLDELLGELTNFTASWSDSAAAQYFADARNECIEFNDLDSDIDIKEFFSKLMLEDIPDSLAVRTGIILEMIDAAFIAQEFYNYSGSVGTAAIWYPVNPQTFSDLIDLYDNLIFCETGWHLFLERTFSFNPTF